MFVSAGSRATRKRKTKAADLISGILGAGVGMAVTPYPLGTISSGTTTLSYANGNQQYVTANGAFTLAPQTTASQIVVEFLNGASAGSITTSGYTKVTGDAYATTNAAKFLFVSTKTQNYSHLNIIALQ